MNPVTSGRKADDGARVGTDKVLKITSAADIGRIRIVKWSRSKKGMFDKEGDHNFDVTLVDGLHGQLNVALDRLPKNADYCVKAHVYAEGKCEYLPLYKLVLASDLSEVVRDLVQHKCFTLLAGCVCNPFFRGLLKGCRNLFAATRFNLISPAVIAVLESGVDTIKYLEKKDCDSIAPLFRMSACEPLISICEAMVIALTDLRKDLENLARYSADSVVRSQAVAMGASARDLIKSIASIGGSMEVIRESLCLQVEDQNA